MKRVSVGILLAVACLMTTACGASARAEVPEFATPAQVSELIASLDEGEAASLDLVTMSESHGGSIEAGTHEDELLTAGYRRADIGAVEWVNGVQTKLLVPMWYGPDTTIQIKGRQPEPMLEAVETTPAAMGPYYWFGDPVVAIEFHMEEQVLVLDSATVPDR